MKLYKNIIITMLAAMFTISCSKYLDVVPDNIRTIESIFVNKDEAYNALAKVYWYQPQDNYTSRSLVLMGDETVSRVDAPWLNGEGNGNPRAERIMRGMMVAGDPLLGTWTGSNGGKPLYEGIRICNIFLHYIKATKNLTEEERKDWIAQAKFFKAYYHFLLMRQYGPIIISDKVVEPDAISSDLFQYRSKVEEVFDFIIKLLDEAIPDLVEARSKAEYGMIDRAGAMAMKGRILLFRASPFFNGNREFYDDFLDPRDGKKFFDVDVTPERAKEKWSEAATALKKAIDFAESHSKVLYTSNPKFTYVKDSTFFRLNPVKMRQLYDLRFVVTDPWNDELIWGKSNEWDEWEIPYMYTLRLPEEYRAGADDGLVEQSGWSRQTIATSLAMAERYYTKNGVQIDEDATFNYIGRYDITATPTVVPKPIVGDPDYAEKMEKYQAYLDAAGILYPNHAVVNMFLNREMRFYANMVIPGGYAREHYNVFPTHMFAAQAGGFKSNKGDGGKEFLCTGMGAQKLVHPESWSNHPWRIVRYPWPIMRLADLYLMYAEALNEAEGPSNPDVYKYINKVRERAHIPKIEDSYGNPNIVKPAALDKHKTKEGMREIILRERSIELAFEGHNFWDMWRHKRAHKQFTTGIQGWDYSKAVATDFFTITLYQSRRFFVRDYLWPIPISELDTNGNIKQNPGW